MIPFGIRAECLGPYPCLDAAFLAASRKLIRARFARHARSQAKCGKGSANRRVKSAYAFNSKDALVVALGEVRPVFRLHREYDRGSGFAIAYELTQNLG